MNDSKTQHDIKEKVFDAREGQTGEGIKTRSLPTHILKRGRLVVMKFGR